MVQSGIYFGCSTCGRNFDSRLEGRMGMVYNLPCDSGEEGHIHNYLSLSFQISFVVFFMD
jgi:hypothetical protein